MIYTGGTTGMPKGVMWRHDDMYRAFNTAGDPAEADLGAVRRRVAAAIRGASRGSMRLEVRFSTSSSSPTPSMMSRGSGKYEQRKLKRALN